MCATEPDNSARGVSPTKFGAVRFKEAEEIEKLDWKNKYELVQRAKV